MGCLPEYIAKRENLVVPAQVHRRCLENDMRPSQIFSKLSTHTDSEMQPKAPEMGSFCSAVTSRESGMALHTRLRRYVAGEHRQGGNDPRSLVETWVR